MRDVRYNRLIEKRDKYERKIARCVVKAETYGNRTISAFTSSTSKNVAYWSMTIGTVATITLLTCTTFPLVVCLLPLIAPLGFMAINSVYNGIKYIFNKIAMRFHKIGYNRNVQKLKAYGLTKERACIEDKITTSFSLDKNKTKQQAPQKIELFKPIKDNNKSK